MPKAGGRSTSEPPTAIIISADAAKGRRRSMGEGVAFNTYPGAAKSR
jgi:hypothetical protein